MTCVTCICDIPGMARYGRLFEPMRPRQCTATIAAIHPVQFEELRHIDTPTELNERIRKFEPTNYLSSRDKSTLEESQRLSDGPQSDG
jgi:hypothetical protein